MANVRAEQPARCAQVLREFRGAAAATRRDRAIELALA